MSSGIAFWYLPFRTHPRAYGNFACLLGKYVREEKLITLEEAIRKLTSLPAKNLGLDRRGMLKEGMFADMVVFDPSPTAPPTSNRISMQSA
jgi:N-acyl-D-amino-acid deacylase